MRWTTKGPLGSKQLPTETASLGSRNVRTPPSRRGVVVSRSIAVNYLDPHRVCRPSPPPVLVLEKRTYRGQNRHVSELARSSLTARVQSVPHMQRLRPNASKTRPQQLGPDWTGLGNRDRLSSASQVRALARRRKTYRREFPCSVLIPPYRAATPQSTPIIPARLTYSPRARGRRGS